MPSAPTSSTLSALTHFSKMIVTYTVINFLMQ
jgi:hypothetical protein